MPTLVPNPGSPTVTQGNLPNQEYDALRTLGLSRVMLGHEIRSLKIRVSVVRLTANQLLLILALRADSLRSSVLIRIANWFGAGCHSICVSLPDRRPGVPAARNTIASEPVPGPSGAHSQRIELRGREL